MNASRTAGHNFTRKLGELLVEAGMVEPKQLERALSESKQTGEPLGKILLKRGLITESELGEMLGAQAGTTYVHLADQNIDTKLLDLLPVDFCTRHRVLPLRLEDGVLLVAMVRPNDVATIDEMRLLTGHRIRALVSTSKEFDDALQSVTASVQGQVSEAIASIRQEAPDDGTSQAQARLDELTLEDQPVVRLLNSIFSDAINRGASDVHLESREKALRVRLRIDGVLLESTTIPKDLEALTISRLKIMANMDIAERRRPQDGRARLSVGGRNYDLRVNTMPNVWGETAVVRILRPAMLVGGFDNLGVYPDHLSSLKSLVESPHGIVLATGPTGSGKTTTLYSALYELNSPERNLLTIEDPVEFPLEGISQTQVNPKTGLSFSAALRSMLRQDPDVIMVGEIRDRETLDSAVFAALTGHLVLSTIHTNDAASAPSRMLEMGLAPYLLTTALRGIIAQRLVRRLCPYCRVPLESDHGLPELLRGRLLYKPLGCVRCRETGFIGRIGLFEVLTMSNPIQELINQSAPSYRLREKAIEEGMFSMEMDALRKVFDGLTTPVEVARALGARWTEEPCRATSTAPST